MSRRSLNNSEARQISRLPSLFSAFAFLSPFFKVLE